MVRETEALVEATKQLESLREYCEVMNKTYLVNKINLVEESLAKVEVQMLKMGLI